MILLYLDIIPNSKICIISNCVMNVPHALQDLLDIFIEMEVSRQFVGRQRVGITAITQSLRGGQKIDRHRASPITIARNTTASAVRKNEGFVELKQTTANTWLKSLAAVQNTGAMNQSSILLSIVEIVRLYRENRLRARKHAGSKSRSASGCTQVRRLRANLSGCCRRRENCTPCA